MNQRENTDSTRPPAVGALPGMAALPEMGTLPTLS